MDKQERIGDILKEIAELMTEHLELLQSDEDDDEEANDD